MPMLEEFESAEVGIIVHRFANLSYVSEFLRNKKTLSDKQALRVLAVRGRRLSVDLTKAPFRRKEWLDGRYGMPTRFSDGTWPTFYAALHEETARREVGHHYAKAAVEAADGIAPVYYSRISCKFMGSHINLLGPDFGRLQLLSEARARGSEHQTRRVPDAFCPSPAGRIQRPGVSGRNDHRCSGNGHGAVRVRRCQKSVRGRDGLICTGEGLTRFGSHLTTGVPTLVARWCQTRRV